MDFSVFNLKAYFTIHEIACLCIGIDPGIQPSEVPADHKTAYALLCETARDSASAAPALYDWYRERGVFREDATPAVLWPLWAWQTLPLASGASDHPSLADLPDRGTNPDGWVYLPETIADWLAVRKVSSVYDFGGNRLDSLFEVWQKRSPSAAEADDDELDPRRRTSMLAIMAALCKECGINPQAMDATRKFQTLVEKAGLKLGEKAVRDIVADLRQAVAARSAH